MNLEQALAKELALLLTQNKTDEHGYLIENLFNRALGEYITKNSDVIMRKIKESLTPEKVANEMSDYFMNRMGRWDREQIDKEIKAELAKILANRMADEMTANR